MTTASGQLTRSLLIAALCLSAGIHLALAVMHVSSHGSLAALFAVAAILTATAAVFAGTTSAYLPLAIAAVALGGQVMLYGLSRTVELPIIGMGPVDGLGLVTIGIELGGIGCAVAALGERRARDYHAPRVVCAMLCMYGFLLAMALPSHHNTTGGMIEHSHGASGAHVEHGGH